MPSSVSSISSAKASSPHSHRSSANPARLCNVSDATG